MNVFFVLVSIQLMTWFLVEAFKKEYADKLFIMSKGKRLRSDTLKAANEAIFIPIISQIKLILIIFILLLPIRDE